MGRRRPAQACPGSAPAAAQRAVVAGHPGRLLVWLVAVLALLHATSTSAGAEEAVAEPGGVEKADVEDAAPSRAYAIDGTLGAGYRLVDVDGSRHKYREDYNFHEGFRLFQLDVAGAARRPDETPLDRFHLEVDTPGNEPVSHFKLSAADRKLYDLRASFVRSKYFYAVPRLFEQAVAGDVRLDDLHDFNTTRTNGTVDLTVRAPHLPKLFFGYRLYERHGDGTSTVLVPAGDTFLVDAPVDTVTNVGRVGTEFTALDTNFFLQQDYRRVDRTFDTGPPQNPAGLDPNDGSTLSFYRSDQDEHLDIPATTVRIRRPLGDAAELRSAYFYSHADLSFDTIRQRTATTTAGQPASDTAQGGGSGSLDTHVADVGATVRLVEWARAHVDYRYNERQQNGTFDEGSSLGALSAAAGDRVRVHSVTGDVEAEPRDDLQVRAGVRYAWREARFSQTLQDISTDTLGVIGSVRYRPRTFLDLYARYENVQVNDPFVVSGAPEDTPPIPEREIVLTFTNRATAGVAVLPRDWITLRSEFTADSRDNSTFDASSQVFGYNVSVAVSPLRDLTFFAGYTRRSLSSEADILIAPLYDTTRSVQDGTEDVLVSELRYDFALGGQRWSTGWDVAYVNADTSLRPNLEPGLAGHVRFDLDRIDGGTFLVLHHRWVEPSVEFRMIDYHEPALSKNDYRATILVFKLTKRWSW